MKENELIAEFMGGAFNQNKDNPNRWGFSIQPTPYYLRNAFHSTLKYDTDWNWLMPVVEKIHKTMVPYEQRDLWADVITLSIYSPIDEVYESVVEFIKWYNEQV